MPLAASKVVQIGLPVRTFASMAAVVADFEFEETVGSSLVLHEPVGVVGAITPWNFPLHQAAAKVAPAIAAGNTVVLKPSEVTPLSALALADVLHEVGLPAGVVNVVTGDGPGAGEAVATHPVVDMVSFTGSTRAGRRVSELAAATVKATALELGGKSANVILDDIVGDDSTRRCAPESRVACRTAARRAPRSPGSSSRERAWPRSRRSRSTPSRRSPSATRSTSTTRLGPLVTSAQRDRVRGYISRGVAEGARLVVGGAEPPEGLDRGYYVRPTVFSDVSHHDDRAGRDLRPGPVHPAVRRRGGRPSHRERQRLRPRRRRLVGRCGPRPALRPADPHGPGPASTGRPTTSRRPSAASSSPVTDASSAGSGSRNSSRRRR